jgi:hypothetical protein
MLPLLLQCVPFDVLVTILSFLDPRVSDDVLVLASIDQKQLLDRFSPRLNSLFSTSNRLQYMSDKYDSEILLDTFAKSLTPGDIPGLSRRARRLQTLLEICLPVDSELIKQIKWVLNSTLKLGHHPDKPYLLGTVPYSFSEIAKKYIDVLGYALQLYPNIYSNMDEVLSNIYNPHQLWYYAYIYGDDLRLPKHELVSKFENQVMQLYAYLSTSHQVGNPGYI